MALMRAGYDGLRRNAAYALGAMRAAEAKPVLERLVTDAAPGVREAAAWALEQLP
ncbi:MAG: HEAT repeat domain-containing protein [Myxococcaceae bacterium]|nr:HEAT repeat domain-containing protein [Myxococcaceae bacterium]